MDKESKQFLLRMFCIFMMSLFFYLNLRIMSCISWIVWVILFFKDKGLLQIDIKVNKK